VTRLSSLVLLAYDDAEQTTKASVVQPGLLSPAQTADIERYLDVTRAEMLFARLVILVEGRAEVFLVPALATAAGFDLDAYGVVVASVEGTDFVPYARLLGSRGFDRPYIVITDGDVTDTAEPGLKRASLLARGTKRRAQLADEVEELTNAAVPADGHMRDGRDQSVAKVARGNVFVGDHTLEVDLAPLFGEEMVAALAEFGVSANLRQEFTSAVRGCADEEPTRARRLVILRRINDPGKGRYAQRLADHVSQVDLRERVLEALGEDDDGQEIGAEDLLGLPGCGHLLAALDDVSRTIRGLSLLGPQEDEATGEEGAESTDPTKT
jgi:putative ATP-dependent endonuclease of OLD family